MIGWWKRWRGRNPGAPVGRLLLWEVIKTMLGIVLFCFYRLRVYNTHLLPKSGPVLLLCNHQSYMDLIMIGMAIPDRHFHPMARKTLFKNRVFAWFISRLNSIELDQTKGDIRAIRTAIERLRQGHLLLLFPEGSRTADGRVHDFQEGVMLLIKRARPTIVPAALEGAYDAWPINGKPRLRGRIAIMLGEPIPADELLKLPPKEVLPSVARKIDAMRLQLRQQIRHQTQGRFPKPGVADGPSFD